MGVGAAARRLSCRDSPLQPTARANVTQAKVRPELAARVARARGLGDVPVVEPTDSGTPGSFPLARQMAKLLANSDLAELEEIVRRWLADAPTDRVRKQYFDFGSKLLELKRALASAPQQPSEEELELALTMMLKLAAQSGPGSGQGPPGALG
jgi:hypothetical protein